MKLPFFKSILTPGEKKSRRQQRYLLLLSGLLLAVSFPPFPFPYLIFFALVPYLFVIEKRTELNEINKATYLMGFVFSLLTIYWVGAFTEGKDPFLMIAGGVLLFFNPLLFLIPSTLYYLARKFIGAKIAFFIFPFFWVTYEYLYMITDIRFPWLVLGNALPYFTHYIQIADQVGATGLSLFILFANVFIYKGIINYNIKKVSSYVYFTLAALIIVFPLVYGSSVLNNYKPADKKVKVGLIQPNLDPYEKWNGGSLIELTEQYTNLSEKAIDKGVEVIIWPETALPVYLLSGGYENALLFIRKFVSENNVFLLTGMPDFRYFGNKEDAIPFAKYSEAGDYYYSTHNAIYLFSPEDSEIQKYGKVKLVPFGEKTPFSDQVPFLGDLIKWGVGLSGWNVGYDSSLFHIVRNYNNLDSHDTIKVCGSVCYESIFPDYTAVLCNKGADFIAVVTNDSWYGNTSGPYQHKATAILRAVENRKSVVRAANGGISCIINPVGITVDETPMFTKGYLVGDVELNPGSTFYMRNPLIIPIISSVISLWIAGLSLLIKLKMKWKL
ncbi:MAG TPA: apolipoprotein N-acyltransferase [Ignavibacteriaceae bacterium]|nr:apolipoprotein N-acyltransferase [Ignavibacteriaceae bacterium]